MKYYKEILGMIGFTAFTTTLFVVLFFSCFHVFQEIGNYMISKN